jgi:hypothetical protein
MSNPVERGRTSPVVHYFSDLTLPCPSELPPFLEIPGEHSVEVSITRCEIELWWVLAKYTVFECPVLPDTRLHHQENGQPDLVRHGGFHMTPWGCQPSIGENHFPNGVAEALVSVRAINTVTHDRSPKRHTDDSVALTQQATHGVQPVQAKIRVADRPWLQAARPEVLAESLEEARLRHGVGLRPAEKNRDSHSVPSRPCASTTDPERSVRQTASSLGPNVDVDSCGVHDEIEVKYGDRPVDARRSGRQAMGEGSRADPHPGGDE